MLPMLLAPAALIAAAQPTVPGPALEGSVLSQSGTPIAASIGLIPMFQREDPFPANAVENKLSKSKKTPSGFQVPIPAPGLYILDVRAKGCQPLQVPVLLGEGGLKDFALTPVPVKIQEDAKPISTDPKVVKLEALFTAQKAREANHRKAVKDRLEQKKNSSTPTEKAPLMDWSADLETISQYLKNEIDADIQALAAISYLELGAMTAKLDPEVASLALEKLPATSPWWAFNPRMANGAFIAARRHAEWVAFRESLSKDNPDPEVRAYGFYSRLSSAYNKGDRETFTNLLSTMTSEYKNTKFGRSAKTFDPTKMPAPPATPPPIPGVPQAAEPVTPPAAEPVVPPAVPAPPTQP